MDSKTLVASLKSLNASDVTLTSGKAKDGRTKHSTVVKVGEHTAYITLYPPKAPKVAAPAKAKAPQPVDMAQLQAMLAAFMASQAK